MITHPDSWTFLKCIYPNHFRLLEMYPEMIYLPGALESGPQKWLQSPEGTIFSISPYTKSPPPLLERHLKEIKAKIVEPNLKEGLVVQSRAIDVNPLWFWCFLDQDSVNRLGHLNQYHAKPQKSLLEQLLELREVTWSKLYSYTFQSRTRQLATPGLVLGWLNYRDRVLFVQRALAIQNIRRFLPLFNFQRKCNRNKDWEIYEFHSLINPEPKTSLPLLLECCPPQVRTDFKYFRFRDSDPKIDLLFYVGFDGLVDIIMVNHLEFWHKFFFESRWEDGFSDQAIEVLKNFAYYPMQNHYKKLAEYYVIKEHRAKPTAMIFAHKFTFYYFSYHYIAKIFYKSPLWPYFRLTTHHLRRRLIEEEHEYMERLEKQDKLDWALVAKTRFDFIVALRFTTLEPFP